MIIRNLSFEVPPEGPVCDFCSNPEAKWSYPAHDVTSVVTLGDESTILSSEGAWAACDKCSECIERGDKEGLLNQSFNAVTNDEQTANSEMTLRLLRGIHESFWRSKCGGRRKISGEA